MKNLQISELLLLSDLEKRARRINFHPQCTVLVGDNGTGKSSILKSIFRTFGAEPAQLHADWKKAEVTSLVRFSVDTIEYSILRKQDFYALFDASERVVGTFRSVTNELGPVFAELVNFQLQLISREGQLKTPPPAYFFLPFYVDQDKGWGENWASFARLSQFADYRRSVAEYHTGIRPNEYYLAKGALKQEDAKYKELENDLRVLRGVQQRMQATVKPAEFNVDLKAFRAEVEELLKQCQPLLELEQNLKQQVEQKASVAADLEAQLKIVVRALAEVRADFKFAADELHHETVDCPTCGAQYANSFVERFEIAKDEERLQSLAIKLQSELNKARADTLEIKTKFDQNHSEVQQIQGLLSTRREEVTLAMVLQSEGRKEVDGAFQRESDDLVRRQKLIDERIMAIRQQIKELEDRKRVEDIRNEYLTRMKLYLEMLNVQRLSEESYKAIDSKVAESGSDHPRALLAYYFAILHLIARNASSTMCPMVIDSPNQQDQDQENLKRMLEFIRDNRPANMQLILAAVNTLGVKYEGNVIEVNDKKAVLQETAYEEISNRLRPMIMSALQSSVVSNDAAI